MATSGRNSHQRLDFPNARIEAKGEQAEAVARPAGCDDDRRPGVVPSGLEVVALQARPRRQGARPEGGESTGGFTERLSTGGSVIRLKLTQS